MTTPAAARPRYYALHPDDQPLPGASFEQAVRRFVSRYASFTGRASRAEYWWVVLAQAAAGVLASGLALAVVWSARSESIVGALVVLGMWGLLAAVGLAMLVPSVALAARRLHDANVSAWMLLLAPVPVLGLALLVYLALPSSPAGARFDRRRPVG